MSPVLEIRERLRKAHTEPGEFQSHAASDMAYLLWLLEQVADEVSKPAVMGVGLRVSGKPYDFRNVELDEDGTPYIRREGKGLPS